jgi:hypothetical protein
MNEYRRGFEHGTFFGGAFVLLLLTLGAICEFLKVM